MHSLMERKDSLSLGLELVTTAVADDVAGRYASAVRHYDLAINYLTQALSDPVQAAHASLISQKIREYSDRRSVLASSLGGIEPPVLAPAVPPPAAAATSINDILRLAFDVAQHARQEDACGNVRGAFELYTQCLESFLIVYKEEQNAMLKDQLRRTILEYTERAEALKQQMQPSAVVAAPSGSVVKRETIRNQDVDGPYHQAVRKQHPGYSGSCELQVTLPRRKFRVDEKVGIHVVVDNQCGRQVETLKCYLLCKS